MRLYELEDQTRPQPIPVKTPEQAWEIIRRDCQPWLSHTKGGTLRVFRGTSTHLGNMWWMFKRSPRPNRMPKDTRPEFHDLLNRAIAAEELAANRTNSLFVTGKERDALTYGEVYEVFPIGAFNFTWAPGLKDAFNAIEFERYFVPIDVEAAVAKERAKRQAKYEAYMRNVENARRRVADRMEQMDYEGAARDNIRDVEIHKGLNDIGYWMDEARSMEKLLNDEQALRDYVLRNAHNLPYNDRKPDETKFLDYLAGKFRGDDDSLPEAITSGHEIMVKCDAAYFVQAGRLPLGVRGL